MIYRPVKKELYKNRDELKVTFKFKVKEVKVYSRSKTCLK